jgi:hypothetical protein
MGTGLDNRKTIQLQFSLVIGSQSQVCWRLDIFHTTKIQRTKTCALLIGSKKYSQWLKVVIQEINTLDGDGICMGFHGGKEGDFGEDDIASDTKDLIIARQ